MALHIKQSQEHRALSRWKDAWSKLVIAEVVASHVERQPVPQTWSGGGKAAVTIAAVCASNAQVWTSAD